MTPRSPSQDAEALLRARSLACLVLAAIGFFVTYLLVVSCLSFPFPRYFVSAALLLPSALTALLAESWRLIVAPAG